MFVRREVMLAIVIGFSIGLLLSAGLILGRKTIRQRITPPPEPVILESEQPSPTEVPPIAATKLTITSPEDETIVNENKVALEGSTEPEAIISIIYEEGEILDQADENGDFSFDIPLIGGANEITISAYGPEGQQASQTITVVYTTAEI